MVRWGEVAREAARLHSAVVHAAASGPGEWNGTAARQKWGFVALWECACEGADDSSGVYGSGGR